jgi:hypothetical protein
MTIEDLDYARLADLRVAEALGELTPEEQLELTRLAAAHPELDTTSFDRATAALLEAAVPASRELPDALRTRLVAGADRYFGHDRTRELEPIPFMPKSTLASAKRANDSRADGETGGFRLWGGWAAAAALGVVSLALWWNRPTTDASPVVASTGDIAAGATRAAVESGELGPRSAGVGTNNSGAAVAASEADATQARDLANSRFALRRAWSPGNDTTGQLVAGDVVWDGDAQRGYMRFKNLRRNNPSIEQYQLWIFDASRDERFPVDGGVFNIEVDRDGNAVVPIRARLPVKTPTLFAVTLERPGGVVVSDRSRIVALARI